MYCNVCCLNVMNTQSLHHKNDWTSKNLDYTLQFLMLLYGYTGCIFFTLLPKPIFPYEMSFYQNPIKYCNMAIYCNTLKHNTQYSINLYCFTPTLQCFFLTSGEILVRIGDLELHPPVWSRIFIPEGNQAVKLVLV